MFTRERSLRGYREVRRFDGRHTYLYVRRELAPFVRAWYWWRDHRWDLERALLERGIMWLDTDGGLLREAYFANIPADPTQRNAVGLVNERVRDYYRRRGQSVWCRRLDGSVARWK